MATQVSLGFCPWLAGETFTQVIGRNDVAGMAWDGANYGGLLMGPSRMAVQAATGMNLTVTTGTAIIPSAAGSTDGAYRPRNNQAQTLTVPTADLVNPRIDLVVCGVQDNGDATSFAYVQIVTGTPAVSPAAPSAPTNAVPLATVLVGAGVTSIVSANITDARVFTVAPGGILPVASTGTAPSGVNGQYAYDTANDRLFHMAAAAPRQARTLPWAPVHVAGSGTFSGGSPSTLLTANVTTDGSTDLEIHACWRGFNAGVNSAMKASFLVYVDTTFLKGCDVENTSTAQVSQGGGAMFHVTSSGGSDTPTSGVHAVTLQYTDNVASSSHASAITGAELYVRAVPL